MTQGAWLAGGRSRGTELPCRIALAGMLHVCVAMGAVAAAAQATDAVAIVHATAWSGEGAPVENATIVMRGGRIVSITAAGAVPANATSVDAEGGVVTTGFVAACTPLGLVEISLESETADVSVEAVDADPVRAAFSAADGYNPASTLIPIARREGITNAVSTPEGGLVSGTSSWVDLGGRTPRETIARDVVALHVDLDEGGVTSAGGALPMALTRLRELLDDARAYARNRARYERRAMRELSTSRLDLERVQEVLTRRIPLVVHVSRASDIMRVLELGGDYQVRIVLAGAEEGWRVAGAIAAAEVPVLVTPLTNLPSTFARLGSRYDNAALLVQAGVRVALFVPGAHEARTLRQEAGNAVAWGLDRDAALRAVTLEPARIFGMDTDYGRLAPGRLANVVVWSGDPFELSSHATHVFIRGAEASLETRQTALLSRYRDLARVPHGLPGRAPRHSRTRAHGGRR